MSLRIDTAAQVQAAFSDQSQASQRIHYIMANQEFDGNLEGLRQQVKQTQETAQVSLDQSSGKEGWTPLEVAVLSGYSFGLQFLIQQGVNPTPRALELAQEHHPEFLPLLGAKPKLKEAETSESSTQGLSSHVIHVGQADAAEALKETLKAICPNIQVQCHPLAQEKSFFFKTLR